MTIAAPDRKTSLPRRALLAAAARRAEFRHAIRVSVAVGAAFALGEVFRLPQAYWAVFTAVIVVQTSVGGTLTASFERLVGTVVGGLIGVAAAYLRARTVVEEGLALSAAIAVAAFAAAVRPSLRVAPITAAIVLVGGATVRMDPLVAAAWRVAEILIGSVVGVAATLLVFPARAGGAVLQRAAQTMTQLAALFALFASRLGGPQDEAEIHRAHQAIRKSLAQVEQAQDEAARESQSGLSRAQIPEGLLRSLRRISNDAVMVGRALAQPLPEAVRAGLGPSAQGLLTAAGEQLETLAAAVRSGAPVEDDRMAQPRAAFEDAVEHVRAARLTTEMTFDAAARVFGLVFALESLAGNLSDLGDRVAEAEHQARPSAGSAPPGAEPLP